MQSAIIDQYEHDGTIPPRITLEDVLQETADFEEVYLIVDSLDQCVEETRTLLELEFERFCSAIDFMFRVMIIQSQRGLPSTERATCDIGSLGCQGSGLTLYWHCETCKSTKGGDMHLCYSYYATGPVCIVE